MKKNAYEDTTITATAKRLKHLQKNSLLADPENIKTFIANKKCSNAFKECLIETYDIYIRSINQKWQKPFYQRYDKLPKIPTEEKLNMLISNASPRMALFLSMSKDLGSRPIELTWLKVADINLQNGIVNLTGAKHKEEQNIPRSARNIKMGKELNFS
jgi:integrase